MTHQSPLADHAPHRPAAIAVLRCSDRFDMDPTPLTGIFAEMPKHLAEDMVCRALEDIAHRLDRLQALRTDGAYGDVAAPARRIASIAGQIGLTTVTTAAEHVACASQLHSGVALGATLARLERAFDLAVSHVWDFRHYTKA